MWEAGPEDHVDFMSDSLPRRAGTGAQAFLRETEVSAVLGTPTKDSLAPQTTW